MHQRAFILWGNQYHSGSGASGTTIYATANQSIEMRFHPADIPYLVIYGNGTTLPAETVVRVYAKVVRGERGPRGLDSVGENNVQANWNEGDESQDSYIRNRPALASESQMRGGTDAIERRMSPLRVRQSVDAAQRVRRLAEGASLPAPTADNENIVYSLNGTLYSQEHIVRHLTAPVATYQDYPIVAADAEGYRGAGRNFPNTAFDNQIWYYTQHYVWYITSHDNVPAGETHYLHYDPAGLGQDAEGNNLWQGHYDDEATATSNVSAVGQIVYIGDSHTGVLRTVLTFQAGVMPRDERRWVTGGSEGVGDTAPASSEQTGVTEIGGDHYSAVWWTVSENEPADPLGIWYTSAGIAADIYPWYQNRESAVLSAGTNPNIPDGATVWIAYGTAYRSAAGNYSYSPWTVVAEYDVQYTADGGNTVTNARETGSTQQRSRLADGSWTAWTWIGTPEDGWIPVWTEEVVYGYNPGPPAKPFVLDMATVKALRFRVQFFGGWDNSQDPAVPMNFGAVMEDILYRPEHEWSTTNSDTALLSAQESGVYSVVASENTGLTVQHQDNQSVGVLALPANVNRGSDLPAQLASWVMKFVAPDDTMRQRVETIRSFQFGGTYARALVTIWYR